MSEYAPTTVTARLGALPLLAAGLVLWSFLLLVPALHLGLASGLPLAHRLLALLPLAVLTISAARASRVGSLLLFPTSMLPLLVLQPDLVGPRVYGLTAFLALLGATAAYLAAALAPTVARGRTAFDEPRVQQSADRGARLITGQTITLGVVGSVVALTLHFYRPFIEAVAVTYGGDGARATILISLVLFLAWAVAVLRHAIGNLGRALVDETHRLTEWYRFEAEATDIDRVRAGFGWSLGIGLGSIGLLFVALTI